MAKFLIDATKYDIRVTWTGLKDDNVPPDAVLVDGWPIDPPDELPGWFLVDFRVESGKDGDRYCSLWAREKTKAKVKKPKKAAQVAAAPKTPKKRGRPRATPEAAPAESTAATEEKTTN